MVNIITSACTKKTETNCGHAMGVFYTTNDNEGVGNFMNDPDFGVSAKKYHGFDCRDPEAEAEGAFIPLTKLAASAFIAAIALAF